MIGQYQLKHSHSHDHLLQVSLALCWYQVRATGESGLVLYEMQGKETGDIIIILEDVINDDFFIGHLP